MCWTGPRVAGQSRRMCPVAATTAWPFPDLRVRAGDLELRYLDDELLHALAVLAARGVHDPDAMPFQVPWTRGTPEQVERSVLAYHWHSRAGLSAERWALELAVLHEGRPVGIQALAAEDFAITRTVTSGSWLGREHQGLGLGTRMRRTMLHLAFEGLGADVARTEAFADNLASNGVTRRLGYRPDGQDVVEREGRAAVVLRYRLDRDDWQARPAADRLEVQLTGVEAVRTFLGG